MNGETAPTRLWNERAFEYARLARQFESAPELS
jgi:hypothetical protein